MKIEQFERPNVLRGVHFGPGTSCGFDIKWWVQFLKSMGIGWIKLVDDAGSMMDFAAACRAAGIMPIIRLYRQHPYPGRLSAKDLAAMKAYISKGITRWGEVSNEPNCWVPEWDPGWRPAWKEGDPPLYETRWFIETAIPMIMKDWLLDAEAVIALGGYPAFPALAQCAFHPVSGSIPFYRAMFNYLQDHHFERTKRIFENGAWLAVHDATLNHFYKDGSGKWHFEYPYDPNCQARYPGRTIMNDDNSAIGHEAPRDMIYNRWKLRLPIVSTEGGVFLDVGRQWDRNYPPISSAEYHGEAIREMFGFYDEYQKTHGWWFGMCPWLVGGQALGHPNDWEKETWKKVDREEPVVRYLQGSPPRRIDVPAEPTPAPTPLPSPSPAPPAPPPPPAPPSAPLRPGPEQYKEFTWPPGNNSLGMHLGLEERLRGAAFEEDIARIKAMRIKWAVIAFAAGEDVMLAVAKRLHAEGIMPIVRKVLTNIDGRYDFGRDARMLVEAGIPAYVQIFNEPGDPREWERGRPKDYVQKWAGLWAQKANEVMKAGGYPGLQCLQPEELDAVFAVLPPGDPVWRRMWFCSHNYGLNHPPDWKEDHWCVLGFQVFAQKLREYLGGYVPPIICGEGGWLYGASDDKRYPKVGPQLHAAYHAQMFEWFRTGKLSDGEPLPDYLFAICPWILSGPSDEAWYGFTEKTATIQAIQAIPAFQRGGEPMAEVPYTLKARLKQRPGFQDLRFEVEQLSDMARVKTESLDAGRMNKSGDPLFNGLWYIVVHHLGGKYYGTLELTEWEIHSNPKVDHATCPYHFVVKKSGEFDWAVALKYRTRGAAGANDHGIHIAFEDDATDRQMETGRFLIAALFELFGGGWGSFRPIGLMPHSIVWDGEPTHTQCPGKVWPKLLSSGPWPKF